MRRFADAILGPLALVAAFWTAASPSPTRPTPQSAHVAAPAPADPLAILNAARAARGVPPLAIDARLSKAAQRHCDDMVASREPFGHGDWEARIHGAGFPVAGRIAESVFAENPGIDLGSWVAWMAARPSEAHARQLLDPGLNLVGIGHATATSGPYSGYLCLDYGVGVPVPSPNPHPPAPPVVSPRRLHATLVVDLDRPDPAAARLASAPGLLTGLAALDCRWRVYPADHPTLASRGFGPVIARAGGPPLLIVQAADGRVLSASRPPADPAGVEAMIGKLRDTEGGR